MPPRGAGEGPPSALRRHGLRPRKRLGQNFLRDRGVLRKILQAAEVGPQDVVLEIGAGTGILTGALSERAGKVLAVELDDALAAVLREEFASDSAVEIWHGNALAFDPCAHFDGEYTMVGNIPYYITGPILRHFLESSCPPVRMVLMVQREVARRMVASPGDLSLLGVSVQYYAEAEIVDRVPAGAFYPRPKVESAIVRLTPRGRRPSPGQRDRFFEVARAGFSVRRKQLANALANGLLIPRHRAVQILSEAGIDGSRRAETLSLPEWESLASVWGGSREREDR